LQKRAKKGFIGPIGDDLPSLIPLIFSLVIFFATFNQTFMIYRSTASRFELVLDALRISNALRGDKYINDFQEFEQLCNNVNPIGLFFKAGLVDLTEYHKPIDIYKFVNENEGAYKSGDKLFVCPADLDERITPNSLVMVNMLPVAYQDTEVASGLAVRPMLLVVVVWR
jgi:hypothetical protein